MMLRILMLLIIVVVIIAILAFLFFRHEISTFAHKFGRREELKEMEHKLRKLELDSEFYNSSMGSEIEKEEIRREIKETKDIIKEIKGEK